MARQKLYGAKDGNARIYVPLEPELAQQLDQWQLHFGFETRGLAAAAMMRAGISAVPLDSVVFAACMAAVRQFRDQEVHALVSFLEDRLRLYNGHKP